MDSRVGSSECSVLDLVPDSIVVSTVVGVLGKGCLKGGFDSVVGQPVVAAAAVVLPELRYYLGWGCRSPGVGTCNSLNPQSLPTPHYRSWVLAEKKQIVVVGIGGAAVAVAAAAEWLVVQESS